MKISAENHSFSAHQLAITNHVADGRIFQVLINLRLNSCPTKVEIALHVANTRSEPDQATLEDLCVFIRFNDFDQLNTIGITSQGIATISATFFLLALIGYLRKGMWKSNAFEHWVVLSLVVGFICQAVFMSPSHQLFDGMFDMAHLLKKVSYICVLIGLMISLAHVLVQAELDSLALKEERLRLERTNEILVSRNNELDEFTYIASHDLQEPLRKLTSFCSLLKKDIGETIPERAQTDMNFITDAALRMQRLIQDLLTLSRVGRSAMNREMTSVDECVNSVLDSLAVRIKETDALITRDNLPEIWADPMMIAQLYQNLIANALKFVSDGERPIIHLSVESDNHTEILGVKDNGIGIRAKYLDQIFVPFKRLHGNTEYEGSGIGLSICRKTVERHGGKLWVESEEGRGSHFKFTVVQRKTARDVRL